MSVRLWLGAPQETLGVANRDLGAIVALERDGITLRLDGRTQRRITFNPQQVRQFDHGYAVTSHSAQGLTTGRVLAHIDTDLSRNLFKNRLAYVAVSRASEDVRIYTNDEKTLGERLAVDTFKFVAIDARPERGKGAFLLGRRCLWIVQNTAASNFSMHAGVSRGTSRSEFLRKGVFLSSEHLKVCKACSSELPVAATKLSSRRSSLKREIEEDISRLRHEYLAFKHQQMAQEPDDSSSRVLSELTRLGDEITSGVLAHMMTEPVPYVVFCPILEREANDEWRTGQFGYFEFVSQLRPEDQNFLAAAAVAGLVLTAPRLMPDHAAEDLAESLSSGFIRSDALLLLIEEGSAFHLSEYLDAGRRYDDDMQRERTALIEKNVTPVLAPDLRELFPHLRAEMLTEFADFSDSMKATQMEVLRAARDSGDSDTDPDPALPHALGNTYDLLDSRTREYLRTAQSLLANKSFIQTTQPAALMLAFAYESEADRRLKAPLLLHLEKLGRDFPANGNFKLVEHGKRNTKLTLGSFFNFMKSNSEVRTFFESRNIDVDLVLKSGWPVINLRNAIAHGDFRTHHTEQLRTMLLGEQNAFLPLLV